MDIIRFVIDNSTDFIFEGGMIVGIFLVFIECFIPALPLSVFVALNVNAFGFLPGFLISWIATCLGSYACYLLFYMIGNRLSQKVLKKKVIQKIRKSIDRFQKIRFSELVLLITMPFTPSFLINILSGLTKVSKEKFLLSLLIGKFFSVIFWGYIGKSLLESLTDIRSILFILCMLLFAYLISKIVSRKMKIE